MQYGINLAANMPCIIWQIQMEALKEISKSIRPKEIESVPFWPSNWEEASAIWGMIDIQQNGQMADQDGLYEVVVNGDGDGDAKRI